LQGKIVHGGTFNGNEEEGKKEETLSISETNTSHTPRFFTGLSREAPLERLFRSSQVRGFSQRLTGQKWFFVA